MGVTDIDRIVAVLAKHRREGGCKTRRLDGVEIHHCQAGCEVHIDPATAAPGIDIQFYGHQALWLMWNHYRFGGTEADDAGLAATLLNQHQWNRRPPTRNDTGQLVFQCCLGCTVTSDPNGPGRARELFYSHQAEQLLAAGLTHDDNWA